MLAEAWTDGLSVKLCRSLDCGDKTLRAHSRPADSLVIVKSVHATRHADGLNRSIFVRNDGNTSTRSPAYVVCSGEGFFFTRELCEVVSILAIPMT